MEGPDGITLEAVGTTDRGSLWRATRRREHDRVVRIVESRFCDERFRLSLQRLRRHRPRMLDIVGEGWAGSHYYIEYAADSPWHTLEERMRELGHWRDRLMLLGDVCDALAIWSGGPVRPLGMNPRNIIVMRNGGRWYPWLLPCPTVTYQSPQDLFGIDEPVLATLAPEVVRGAEVDGRSQDAYALGTLAALAVGCTGSRFARSGAARVEAQARGVLLPPAVERSQVERYLWAVPEVRGLFTEISRYRHSTQAARPADAGALRAAVAEAVDRIGLATTLRGTNPRAALEILARAAASDGPSLASLRLAAEISVDLGDLRAALGHLDTAVELDNDAVEIRRQRCDLRWAFASYRPGDVNDADLGLLLEDLNWLKSAAPVPMVLSALHVRAARVHLGQGDPARAAQELDAAISLAPSDIDALYLYAQCWVDLGDRANAVQVAEEALRRVDKMAEREMLGETEARQWRERFSVFLSR